MIEKSTESNFVSSLDALASAGGRWLWKSNLRDGLPIEQEPGSHVAWQLLGRFQLEMEAILPTSDRR